MRDAAPHVTRIRIRYAPYIGMGELADILNFASGNLSSWTAETVRTWLDDAGALIFISAAKMRRPSRPTRTKRRIAFTTLEKLREAFPELAHQVSSAITREMLAAVEATPDASLVEELPPGSVFEQQESTLDTMDGGSRP